MVALNLTVTGIDRTTQAGRAIAQGIRDRMPELFRILGMALVENVRHRIISRDDGRWAAASKWARAKTGYNFPTLLGAEKYVRSSINSRTLTIYGNTGKPWTLTQHHEGFTNQLKGPDEETDEHGRVVIPIKDGAPLNLYQEYRRTRDGQIKPRAQVFAFVPRKAGATPARKIWPDEADVVQLAQPIASEWIRKIVAEAGA